jgi:cytochrome c553
MPSAVRAHIRRSVCTGILVALPLAALAAGCADDTDQPADSTTCTRPDFRAQSSSIALDSDGHIWLTSPDDDRLHRVNAETLQVEATWEVVAGAHHVAVAGETVVITGALDSRLTIINRASGAQASVDTPCGGTHAVVALDAGGTHFAFTCANDGEVNQLNAVSGSILPLADTTTGAIANRPTALAVDACSLAIGDQLGDIEVWTLGEFDSARGVLNTGDSPGFSDQVPERALLPHSRISSLSGLTAIDGGFAAVATRVDADGPRDLPVEDSTYGSVVDGDPRIAPIVLGSCVGEYAIFDGGDRVFSGPVAVTPLADDSLVVAHAWTHNLALVQCAGDGAQQLNSALIASTGDGVRGLVTNAEGTRIWVDVGYDHAIQRVDRTPDGWTSTVARREPGANRYSPRAQQGRRLFHDATDQHLTPSGIVACATCHPDGGDDGLTWFLHTATIAPKVRRTPSASVSPSVGALHWDGEFDSASTLSITTIRNLMGGDALLIDPQNLAAYMAELPPLPARPVAVERRADTEAGRVLFNSGSESVSPCVNCHLGDEYSDGEMHSVLPPATDTDAQMDSVVTPGLRGVRARSPYFHDGRSPGLIDAIRVHADEQSRTYGDAMNDTQLEQLALYLLTL